MKVVFVSAPFTAKTEWEKQQNVMRAMEIALAVWRLGAVAVCPNANSMYFAGALEDDRVFNEGYLALLQRCDAIIIAPGWFLSAGCQAEYNAAMRWGLPVFEHLSRLKHWLEGEA